MIIKIINFIKKNLRPLPPTTIIKKKPNPKWNYFQQRNSSFWKVKNMTPKKKTF